MSALEAARAPGVITLGATRLDVDVCWTLESSTRATEVAITSLGSKAGRCAVVLSTRERLTLERFAIEPTRRHGATHPHHALVRGQDQAVVFRKARSSGCRLG